MTWHMLYLAFHFLGLALSLGGVLVVDMLFFVSRRSGDVGPATTRILPLLSRLIWIGLILLLISGAFLFSEHPDRYLHSARFQLKITLVVIAAVNGVFMSRRLIPRVGDLFDFARPLPTSALVSGVLSVSSWLGAMLLAVFGRADISIGWLTGGYVVVVLIGVAIGRFAERGSRRVTGDLKSTTDSGTLPS